MFVHPVPNQANMSNSRKSEGAHEVVLRRDYDVWSEVLGLQNSNSDVEIVCQNGSVPAHAFILKLVSPFMDELLTDLGEKYIDVRTILMPDCTVTSVQQVIELVYLGSTNAATEEEGNILKKIMGDLFQIQTDGVDISLLYGCESESFEPDSSTSSEEEETTQTTDFDFDMVDEIPNNNMTSPGTDLPTPSSSLTLETIPLKHSVTEANGSASPDTTGLQLSDLSASSNIESPSPRSRKKLKKLQTSPGDTKLRLEHDGIHCDSQTRQVDTNSIVRKKYNCLQCDATFSSLSKQQSHLASHDPSLKKYKCEHNGCEARFLWPSDLTRHMNCHKPRRNAVYKCQTCPAVYKGEVYLRKHQQKCTGKDNFQSGIVQAEDVDMVNENLASTGTVETSTRRLARATPLYHPKSEPQGSSQTSSLELGGAPFSIESPRRSSRPRPKKKSESEVLLSSSNIWIYKQEQEHYHTNERVLRSSTRTNRRVKYEEQLSDDDEEDKRTPSQEPLGRKKNKMPKVVSPTRGSGRRGHRPTSSMSISDAESISAKKVAASDSGFRPNKDSIAGTSKIIPRKLVESQKESIAGTSKIIPQKLVGSQKDLMMMTEEPFLVRTESNSKGSTKFEPLIPQELSIINMSSYRKNRKKLKKLNAKSAKVNRQPVETITRLGSPPENVVEPGPSARFDLSSAMPSSPLSMKVALATIPPPEVIPFVENNVDVKYDPSVELMVNTFHSEISLETFAEKAKECGKCKAKYNDAFQSEQCIDSHNLSRCHFCLELFDNMATYLQHYTDTHGSRCWICGNIVQFQNAEDHVFWEHLNNV